MVFDSEGQETMVFDSEGHARDLATLIKSHHGNMNFDGNNKYMFTYIGKDGVRKEPTSGSAESQYEFSADPTMIVLNPNKEFWEIAFDGNIKKLKKAINTFILATDKDIYGGEEGQQYNDDLNYLRLVAKTRNEMLKNFLSEIPAPEEKQKAPTVSEYMKYLDYSKEEALEAAKEDALIDAEDDINRVPPRGGGQRRTARKKSRRTRKSRRTKRKSRRSKRKTRRSKRKTRRSKRT